MATEQPDIDHHDAREAKQTPSSPSGNEHRSVSVLMVDIVGSTDLMERLGHEAYSSVLQSFHSMCTGVVRHHGGIVAEYLGDGILCYFGLPHASEDDAAHAVKAALEIIGDLKKNHTDKTRLQARLGLSSGSVMFWLGTHL